MLGYAPITRRAPAHPLGGANPTSYEASLVKLRVVTGSVVAACHMVGCSRSVAARGCVAPSSHGLVDGCAGTPCRPPPIRAGKVRRTPHSACAMTSACSTAEERPIYGIGAGSHRPAQVGCGRPGPRHGMRHAVWPCSPPSLLAYCLSHSLVRPAPRAFFRPDHSGCSAPRADLVKAGPQGHPVDAEHRFAMTGLALTRSSTVPGWRCRVRCQVPLMRRPSS
jgi:hypothetical protein